MVFLFHLLSTTSKSFSSLSTRLAHAARLGFFYKKTRYINSLLLLLLLLSGVKKQASDPWNIHVKFHRRRPRGLEVSWFETDDIVRTHARTYGRIFDRFYRCEMTKSRPLRNVHYALYVKIDFVVICSPGGSIVQCAQSLLSQCRYSKRGDTVSCIALHVFQQ